jgi:hypothetical protein
MNSLLYWLQYLKRLAVTVKRLSIDALGTAFKECKENPQEQARVLDNMLNEYIQGSPSDQRLSIFLRASGRHNCPVLGNLG